MTAIWSMEGLCATCGNPVPGGGHSDRCFGSAIVRHTDRIAEALGVAGVCATEEPGRVTAGHHRAWPGNPIPHYSGAVEKTRLRKTVPSLYDLRQAYVGAEDTTVAGAALLAFLDALGKAETPAALDTLAGPPERQEAGRDHPMPVRRLGLAVLTLYTAVGAFESLAQLAATGDKAMAAFTAGYGLAAVICGWSAVEGSPR